MFGTHDPPERTIVQRSCMRRDAIRVYSGSSCAFCREAARKSTRLPSWFSTPSRTALISATVESASTQRERVTVPPMCVKLELKVSARPRPTATLSHSTATVVQFIARAKTATARVPTSAVGETRLKAGCASTELSSVLIAPASIHATLVLTSGDSASVAVLLIAPCSTSQSEPLMTNEVTVVRALKDDGSTRTRHCVAG
mmetsp:Transcript_23380/g.72406  ORF Transcript_23380/g.72406 Transcript_23380/m.72406 type:complete len:200 (+) Transcript_23380:575-1174(+)